MPNPDSIDPQQPNTGGDRFTTIIIYGYVPAITLCGLGVATYTVAFIVHLIRTIQGQSYSTAPLVVACAMELVGYIFRTLSSQVDPYRAAFFVVQFFLITTAPILITTSMYISLTETLHMMQKHDVRSAPFIAKLSTRLILWLFIAADILTTIFQVTGAALIGANAAMDKDITMPTNIVLAGIGIQTLFFIIYLALLARTLVSITQAKRRLPQGLSLFVSILLIASLCILVRLVFRLIETGEGVLGYLMSHEAFFGALEYFPVFIAIALLAGWHPTTVFKVSKGKSPTGMADIQNDVKS